MRTAIVLAIASLSGAAAAGRPGPTTPRSPWGVVPRGGSDDGGEPSSAEVSSFLSGMDLPGMPDLSKPPSAEQMQQGMEQLTSMLSSPQFKDMLSDPTKMEEALESMRKSLLTTLE